ncbi:nuclear transport factor 2 family protein [Tsukamurella asaccharolytica]|uniref:Nuclear transport factor 2 family protein n=1 Tax=Tsukamurella asaccharolytica TaxID=2592067 RepID=A0A5C5RA38_9ACTN|nr:nuclear transport factor 2 family protein [Tsukamurella asaccharolytica]TWS18971.1 nuclear transport factor 2 family protein [Tsukamurella asaccharolytica]
MQRTIPEGEVLAAADRIIEAFTATDTDGYFAGFDPRATFVFHTEPRTLADRAEYERLWAGWIDSGWRVISCESTARIVTAVGGTAVFSHDVHTVTQVRDGSRTETRERESIVFATAPDGTLVAVHEHLSAS